MNILTDLTFNINEDAFISHAGRSGLAFHHAEEFVESLNGNLTEVKLTDVEDYVLSATFKMSSDTEMSRRLVSHLLIMNNFNTATRK